MTVEAVVNWGDVSTDKLLVLQAGGPEFKTHNPCKKKKKPSMVTYACNSSARKVDTLTYLWD